MEFHQTFPSGLYVPTSMTEAKAVKREAVHDTLTSPDYIARSPHIIGSSLSWFDYNLEKHNLDLHHDSTIAKARTDLRAINKFHTAQEDWLRPSADYGPALRTAYSLDFTTKLLHQSEPFDFEIDRNRWSAFKKQDTLLTLPGNSSNQRNTLWETCIGAAASTFCSEVVFAEPDIVCTMAQKRIGIAAKVAYEENALESIVKDGAKQIVRAGVDHGIIFINVASLWWERMKCETVRVKSQFKKLGVVQPCVATVTQWCDSLDLKKWSYILKTAGGCPIGIVFFVPMFVWLDHIQSPAPFFYVHQPCWVSETSLDTVFANSCLQVFNQVLAYQTATFHFSIS